MTLRCEVLVVGAGVAGVPAAVAAARAGAQTVLIEKGSFPGGTGVAGLHQYICGLYLNSDPPSGELLNAGLVAEICRLMGENERLGTGRRLGRVDVLPYSPARFQTVLSGLMSHESRLQVMFGAAVKGAGYDGNRITSVYTDAGEMIPRIVIDCSGDGVIIQSSPELHEIRPEHERQLAGGAVYFKGISDPHEMLAIRVPYALRLAKDAGRLPSELQFSVFSSQPESGEGWCKLSFLPAGLRRGRTVAEAAKRVHAVLKELLVEFAGSEIAGVSPEVLEREGACLKGCYKLTGDDIRVGRKFSDGIVRNAWPMECWVQGRGPTYDYVPAGDYYEIPLRCLKAAAASNLLCAGRCISVSFEALGSTRVMGPCMAMGEVAGKEAAGMAQV